MNIPKRTEGINKGCLGPIALYKYYVKQCDILDKRPIPYNKFSTILKSCNRELIRLCAEESEIVRLPFRLGYLQICKFEKSYNVPINKLPIDWARTNELGFRVLHENRFSYKWCWLKKTSLATNRFKYKFTACREAKRSVAKAIKELKTEYYGKPNKYG